MLLVMPGIYDFEDEMSGTPAFDNFKGKKWGWHKLADLTEAANNILKKQDEKRQFSPAEIADRFTALASGNLKVDCLFWDINRAGKFLNWGLLKHNAEPETFVPAGWGIEVIDNIKQGYRRVIVTLEDTKLKVWGIKQWEFGNVFRHYFYERDIS